MVPLKRMLRLAGVFGLLLGLLSSASVVAADVPPPPGPALPQVWADAGCQSYLIDGFDGVQAVAVCLPPDGQPAGLILYAHGYVSPVPTADIFSGPTGNPWDDINPVEIDAVSGLLPTVLGQGYAFATTTYSKKGYAIRAAEGDLLALVSAVDPAGLLPVVQTGASEGGIITAMMLEQHPVTAGGPFVGGLALCGPLGGMPEQVAYLGDFAHGFDQQFPRVMRYQGSSFGVTDVPEDAWTQWNVFQKRIQKVVDRYPDRIGYLFAATGAPRATVPDTYYPTTEDVLHFSIFGTNDLQATAQAYNGGTQPYETSLRLRLFYPFIPRIHADQAADFVSAYYDTTGDLTVPMVSMHTLYDAQVPARHELLYLAKEGATGKFIPLLFDRYGHCTFSQQEVELAFGLLQLQLSGTALFSMAAADAPPLAGQVSVEAAQQVLAVEEAQAQHVLAVEGAPAPVER